MVRELVWDRDTARPGFKPQERQHPRSDFPSHTPKLKCSKGRPHYRKFNASDPAARGGI